MSHLSRAFHQEKKSFRPGRERKGFRLSPELIMLFFGIIPFEIIVIRSSTDFFLSTDLSLGASVIFAMSVEFFYMFFSSRGGLQNTVFRVLFFSVGFFTVFHGNYYRDASIKRALSSESKSLEDERSSLANELNYINNSLKSLAKEKAGLAREMSEYRERGYLTRGNKVISKKRKEIKSQEQLLLKQKHLADKKIKEINKNDKDVGFFEGMKYLSFATWLVIATFAVLQLAICFTLPEILDKALGVNKQPN